MQDVTTGAKWEGVYKALCIISLTTTCRSIINLKKKKDKTQNKKDNPMIFQRLILLMA